MGIPAKHIIFDKHRPQFAPNGKYAFRDNESRRQTYVNVARYYGEKIKQGEVLIIDTGARDDFTREPLVAIPSMHYVYLHCPLWVAIARETKRSITGENRDLQGAHFLYLQAVLSYLLPESLKPAHFGKIIPYYPPSKKPDIVIDTSKRNIEVTVSDILSYLNSKNLIPNYNGFGYMASIQR